MFVGFKIHLPIGYSPASPCYFGVSYFTGRYYSIAIPCLNHELCLCAFHWSTKNTASLVVDFCLPCLLFYYVRFIVIMSLPSFPLAIEHVRLNQKTHTQNRWCDPTWTVLVIHTFFTLMTVLNKYRYNWYIRRTYPGQKQRPTV